MEYRFGMRNSHSTLTLFVFLSVLLSMFVCLFVCLSSSSLLLSLSLSLSLLVDGCGAWVEGYVCDSDI